MLEKYLLEQMQQLWKKKMGKHETNEYVIMAKDNKETATIEEKSTEKQKAQETTTTTGAATSSSFSPPSLFQPSLPAIGGSPSALGISGFGRKVSSETDTSASLVQQLVLLRQQQQTLREELQNGNTWKDLESIAKEIQAIDVQKRKLKDQMKKF